jgi:hypothetical protein
MRHALVVPTGEATIFFVRDAGDGRPAPADLVDHTVGGTVVDEYDVLCSFPVKTLSRQAIDSAPAFQ